MPKITAIIHTRNDALRIGRLLDSLRPCDEVIVVDHASEDDTCKVAQQHGADVKKGLPGVEPGAYVIDARYDWILCLRACEALSEALEASLHEWKEGKPDDVPGFAFAVREETASGWRPRSPEMRLANRARINWTGELPPPAGDAPQLPGDLLSFCGPERPEAG